MIQQKETPCASCGKPVGNGAVKISFAGGEPRTREYHSECWAQECRDARVAAGKPAVATRGFSNYRRPQGLVADAGRWRRERRAGSLERMKRRGFVAAVLALPFVGGVVGRARAETRPAPAVPAVSAEETVWEHLDHCSSWEETVVKLRAYAEAGHADADVLRRVAATIERGISSAGARARRRAGPLPRHRPDAREPRAPRAVRHRRRARRAGGAHPPAHGARVVATAVARVAFAADCGGAKSSKMPKVAAAINAAFGRFAAKSADVAHHRRRRVRLGLDGHHGALRHLPELGQRLRRPHGHDARVTTATAPAERRPATRRRGSPTTRRRARRRAPTAAGSTRPTASRSPTSTWTSAASGSSS